jgi:hypothetical protein
MSKLSILTLVASTVGGLLAAAVFGPLVPASAQQPPASAAKPYVPTPADLMLLVQFRHAKLWLAGDAANWELANFALHEMEEGFEDMAKVHPTYKDVAFGPMIDGSMKPPIEEIEQAIKSRNRAAFAKAFDQLTAACNGCHRASNHAFIVIRRPSGSPFPNQSFAPAKK